MKTISGEEFKIKILSKLKSFNDLTINIENEIILQTQSLNIELTFKNIIFKGDSLIFHDRDPEAPFNRFCIFENCTFLCNIHFSSSTFKYLKFISCKIKNQFFQITSCKIKNLSFEENNEKINEILPTIVESGYLKISDGKIETIDFENIIFNNGSLSISNLNQTKSFSITRSTLNTVIFSHCTFNDYFHYIGNKVVLNSNNFFFNHCNFPIFAFFETKLNNSTHFHHCTFSSSATFQSIENEINGELKFTTCDFNKFTDFDKSKIHKLRIEKTKFYDLVSFQETYFDIIEIDKTNFEKGAFFDDIQIKKIDNCDRRTIRTIKQELQKKENKIDFNRFRVYEFNAYRKDIRKKLAEFKKDKNRFHHRKREPIQLKRDLFILNISDIASEYGTDWKRAIKFTLLSGFAAFTLFFILENFKLNIDLNDWQDFVYSYFRFFLITDFKNEYYEAGERVLKFNSIISLFPFIIGKIAIAFGIYEMIQSFRKFKA